MLQIRVKPLHAIKLFPRLPQGKRNNIHTSKETEAHSLCGQGLVTWHPNSEQDDGSSTSLSSSSRTRWSGSFGRVGATFQLISRSGCQLDLRPTERLSAEWSVQHSVRLFSRSEQPKKKLDVNSRSFRRSSHRPQISKPCPHALRMESLHLPCWVIIGLEVHMRRRRNCDAKRKTNMLHHSRERAEHFYVYSSP